MRAADRARFEWFASAMLLGLIAAHAVPTVRPPGGAWGLVGMLAVPGVLRWAVVIAAFALAWPPLAARAVGGVRLVAGRAAGAGLRLPQWGVIALLTTAGWVWRGTLIVGDGPQTADLLRHGQLINAKEPLDRLVTALVYRAGHALTGWAPETAMALVSVLAGVVFWLAVARFARTLKQDGLDAWLVWVILGATGAVEVFFGHQENYALLTAGAAWTLVLAVETAGDRHRPLWPVALVYGLTVATHLSAVWLCGGMVACWAFRVRRGELRRAATEAIGGAAVSLAPLAAVLTGMALVGPGLAGFSASSFGGGDGVMFVPLTHVSTAFERFTMFSGAHLAAFGNELLLTAPVGLVLVIAGRWRNRRIGAQDAGSWVLGSAAVGATLYAFVFNPDMMVFYPDLGPFAEWDLFAVLAVPVTMLGLWRLAGARSPGRARDALAGSAAVAALLHALTWIAFNALAGR